MVNCYVSREVCWERIAETSILPLWPHVHLLCDVGDQNLIVIRERREHLLRRVWQQGYRRIPKWYVCRGAIGENSLALYAGPRHMSPAAPTTAAPNSFCVPPRLYAVLSSRKSSHQESQARRCTDATETQPTPVIHSQTAAHKQK